MDRRRVRSVVRTAGTVLILAGVALLAWAALVWLWQDPFTYLANRADQRALARDYDRRVLEYQAERPRVPAARAASLPAEARRYRTTVREGDAIGRLTIPRLDLSAVLVEGTNREPLKRGPGRDPRTYMPGEGELVYIAGHRTTYGAPFSRIDALKRGDVVRVDVPYATFEYEVTGHRIVRATYLAALRSRGREEVALQACWPRFFASHRYIAYARLVRVERKRPESDSAGSRAGRTAATRSA